MDEPGVLDRRPSPRIAVIPLYVVALLVALAVAAAALIEVDEAVIGRGALRPAGDAVRVMAVAGGRVEALLVAEGDTVVADQPLLRIEAPEVSRAIASLTARVAAGRDEVARRQAVLDEYRRLADLDVALAQGTRAVQAAELKGVGQAARSAARGEKIRAERLERTAALADEGTEPAESVATDRLDREAARAEVARLRAELSSRREALSRMDKVEQRAALAGRLQALAAEVDLLDARARLAEVERSLADAREADRRATIHAPIAGVIHALAVRAPGEVISAGAVLGQVVPAGGQLEVEVLVPASRIAEVRPGQAARLKLDAFPYADHGALAGEVVFVAPDVAPGLAPAAPPGFKVRVAPRPEGRWLTAPLRAGMTLTAELIGRRERLGWFLLRPLRGTVRALAEEKVEPETKKDRE